MMPSPLGEILHGLFQEECAVCEFETEGISWRRRSPWQQREQWQRRNRQQQRHGQAPVPIASLHTQLPAHTQGAPATRSAPSLSPAEIFIQNARLNADSAGTRGAGVVAESAEESANAAAAAFIAASRQHYDSAADEGAQSAPTHVQLSRRTGQQDVNFFV